ncbi:MAG: Histidine--tRNA ligase [Chlamydiae bacterium]|nr:Histidine--tRNA ligase [Chlamydiota bacterium]
MTTQAPKGTYDILPNNPKEEWKSSFVWQQLEQTAKQIAFSYGFEEIRTPIFESLDLFSRSVGESSDIVSKEMYTFEDRAKRKLALRPEGTACAARAFITNHLDQALPISKLFYIGPMFRYERPQAGRFRQHHQFGVEVFGSSSYLSDAEVISMLYHFLTALGLKDLTVLVHSLGDLECRKKYKEALVKYLTPLKNELSEDSKKRLEHNPLRILDSKDETDQRLLKNAPKLMDFLSNASKEHFAKVCQLLEQLQIPYTIDNKLVRGLDYYTETVFEIVTKDLGAQNTLGAGGRYDGLLKQLKGPDIPACGFACGLERILQTMHNQSISLGKKQTPLLLLFPMNEDAFATALYIANLLRTHNIAVDIDPRQKKMGQSIQFAEKRKIPYFSAIGDNEMNTKMLTIKNLSNREETQVEFKNLVTTLENL